MPATPSHKKKSFVWIPGVGPSAAALTNLRETTHIPSTVPGEAWFMGERRRMYDEFFEYSPLEIPKKVLCEFLWEASSGTSSFSEDLDEVENWRSWFRYLLPTLIIRGDEKDCFNFLIEAVITAFFSIYRNGWTSEHAEFRENILDTLGTAIMMPSLWDVQGESITAQGEDWSVQRGPACDGALSASLFFCLSYLKRSEVAAWTESLLTIDSAFFRAHFLTWLAGSYEILAKGVCSFREIEKAPFEVQWENSFLLDQLPPTISNANRQIFLSSLKANLTTERLCEWLDDIAQYPPLYEPLSMAGIAETVNDVVLAG